MCTLFLLTILLSVAFSRVPEEERTFSSVVIDKYLVGIKDKFKDPELADLFESCYPNTLDTTVYSFTDNPEGDEDTFLITGDITAMWLRDSTNQILPYLRFANHDSRLKALIRGVLNRQVKSVLIDPYANAFNFDKTGHPDSHTDDNTKRPSFLGTRSNAMTNEIFERKFEIDSLAAVLALSAKYYNTTMDSLPYNDRWVRAVKLIISTARKNQVESSPYHNYEYTFTRICNRPTETLMDGQGWPSRYTGLIRSGFRPSDDATKLPYFIPGNIMFLTNLRYCADILENVVRDKETAADARKLADEIDEAVHRFGIVNHPFAGEVYAYEVDGFGSAYFMDDANIPSLLSLPFLGYLDKNDVIYQNTRKMILSEYNPYFFKGKVGEGIGGPHVGPGYIWPMSLIVRAYTSDNKEEILECIDVLKKSATNGYMHESFFQDDFNSYTRPWFAWTNSLFGDMLIDLMHRHPDYILKNSVVS
ncbi:TAT pathway signal protein [Blastocystis sp. subtype 4]|uniref:TAT pathway signal protein n=1 Tax=Blastocystis sp. subtype 4 TaxID=944170 RepID=UPI000711CC7D|nr:TAT pathway signal protein [Blastocystis sp. subtype 4]KNB45843.1 TAT pathway signal protein [Blastocystis sp. subtype 4]|eukprot:XP_014529286.1 TAT pathway signal protein [Blastocystis sp. subtype 4]